MKIVYKLLYFFFYYTAQNLLRFKIYTSKSSRKGHLINDSQLTEGILVNSPLDYSSVAAIHLRKPDYMYTIHLEGGYTTTATIDHQYYNDKDKPIHIRDLKTGMKLATRKGAKKITKIKKTSPFKEFSFDLSVANSRNAYYTDGVVSHNSVTTAIFLVWYFLFNENKNVVALSQNDDKVKDLISKIKDIVRMLPWHLKPGIIKNDEHTLHIDNGSKIKATTTTISSAAGITADLLYMDEFALIDDKFLNIFYRTAFPTISANPNAKVLITSTPRGLNKFFDIYDGALRGKNNYHPLRVDWYEVDGHDDDWRDEQIADMGSVEDFNQEYGNQFLSSSEMIFNTDVMKKLRRTSVRYVYREIDDLLELNDKIDWTKLTWHPAFDLDTIQDEETRWLITVDLAGGEGKDYTVFSIFQLLPMTKKDIGGLRLYTRENDFFKLVQVGQYRTNLIDPEKAAVPFYHLATTLFDQDRLKAIIEINYEGRLFIKETTLVYGDKNDFDDDAVICMFKHAINAVNLKQGIKMKKDVKSSLCNRIKDKCEYNQMVLTENNTVLESANFVRKKNGTYSAQAGNDDSFMTCVSATAFYETEDFDEFVEDLLECCPKSFIKEIEKLLDIELELHDDEIEDFDYEEIM